MVTCEDVLKRYYLHKEKRRKERFARFVRNKDYTPKTKLNPHPCEIDTLWRGCTPFAGSRDRVGKPGMIDGLERNSIHKQNTFPYFPTFWPIIARD
ncbi:hypothetical protein TNIN_217351 [Trichonephila inaurata madagascariensis]|uniref:Uncharacterized protein n=1 Tax=Trichonephila inaurata madagascariensis TaxID=2747483 RepID=A0A8X6XVQ9_9ARAC|nr:hypothetical protein TNIN_217351 [Trichonephila inaurata madagascariensis]